MNLVVTKNEIEKYLEKDIKTPINQRVIHKLFFGKDLH